MPNVLIAVKSYIIAAIPKCGIMRGSIFALPFAFADITKQIKYFRKGMKIMTFTTTEDVKKWFRNITLAKKELDLKVKFYSELLHTSLLPSSGCTEGDREFYRNQVQFAQKRYINCLDDTERLLSLLDADERTVLTAKYLNHISWDAMEFHVFYSRRQAFRIHDQAIEKLVGQKVGVGV